MDNLITIDIGNTNCSMAIFKENDISKMKKVSNKEIEEIEKFLRDGALAGVNDFAVSSVNISPFIQPLSGRLPMIMHLKMYMSCS